MKTLFIDQAKPLIHISMLFFDAETPFRLPDLLLRKPANQFLFVTKRNIVYANWFILKEKQLSAHAQAPRASKKWRCAPSFTAFVVSAGLLRMAAIWVLVSPS